VFVDSNISGDANAYKLAFWIMSYILFDKKLYDSIRAETLPAVQNDGLDLQYLANECPLLRSIYHEALRLTKRDLAFRKVEQDTEIGGKVLRGGNFAIVPVCQLHDNEDVFGSDARTFRSERFLKHQDLTNNQSFKPYGGGKTYCPGRFFAMQEIFGFVALAIHRFDIQLAFPAQRFPVPDESLLTLGVSRPVPGSDVLVTMSNVLGKSEKQQFTGT
jgi:cytochrome P450